MTAPLQALDRIESALLADLGSADQLPSGIQAALATLRKALEPLRCPDGHDSGVKTVCEYCHVEAVPLGRVPSPGGEA